MKPKPNCNFTTLAPADVTLNLGLMKEAQERLKPALLNSDWWKESLLEGFFHNCVVWEKIEGKIS